MKNHYRPLISVTVLVTLLAMLIAIPASAAYENTHVNTGNQVQDILAIAATQVGYREGSNNETKFGAWYPMNYNPWCAMFVSWCAEQAGIPTTVIPKHASCDIGMSWFKRNSQWQDSAYFGGSYIPKAGDIIYFGVPHDSNHVGIVRYSAGGYVYTVEGNASDMVKNKSYALDNSNILGYGIPTYSGSSPSGMCGASVTWTLSPETGHMVISGTGNMIDWALPENQVWAAYRNQIKSVSVESTVTSVGTNAFAGCIKLTKVSLSSGQTKINAAAFMGCNSLKEITIPANVTRIGNYAFYGCSSLTSASVLNKSLTYESQVFYGTPASFILNGYRSSTTEAYASANGHTFRALDPVETTPPETKVPETEAPAVIPDGVVNLAKAGTVITNSANDVSAAFDGKLSTGVTLGGSGREAWIGIQLNQPAILSFVRLATADTNGDGKTERPHSIHLTVVEGSNNGTTWKRIMYFGDPYDEYTDYAAGYESGNNYWTEYAFDGETDYDNDAVTPVAYKYYRVWNDDGNDFWGEVEFWGTLVGTPETPETPKSIPGDITGDSKVDINDAMLLFQHTMLPSMFPISYTGSIDFNGDGSVDINDAMRLFQYSMLPNLFPLA